MKPKMICKIGIDLIMIVLLLLLMAKQLTENFVHEWMGAGMFVFLISSVRYFCFSQSILPSWGYLCFKQIEQGTYSENRELNSSFVKA